MRLYVGKFAGGYESAVREHFSRFDSPSVSVIGLEEIVNALIRAAESDKYTDDPVVVAVKALNAAGRLQLESGKP